VLLGQYSARDGFMKRGPVLEKLCQPIMDAMTTVEADHAQLSRVRALVRTIESHALQFTHTYGDLCEGYIEKQLTRVEMALLDLFDKRLRAFYYKDAFSATFLLDPVNFKQNKAGTFEISFATLPREEEEHVSNDVERLGGDKAVEEFAQARLQGFPGLNKLDDRLLRECVLVKEIELPDGTFKRTSAPVQKRKLVWEKVLSQLYPELAKVASQNLSMHCTSCAAERNLSVFRRIFDKLRGSLHLKRAEKMVYLAVNDRIAKRKLDTGEEELPFTDVDLMNEEHMEQAQEVVDIDGDDDAEA
jgi:hypothetical protein